MSISIGDAVLYFKGDLSNLNQAADAAQTKIQSSMQAMTASTQTLGIGFAALGAAIVAPMALGVKAAIEFESAFAGVRKTVDASEAEFAVMREQFTALSLEIPVTTTELMKIGEAAGQLGIRKENILGFTRTIADLGIATNLAGEEGATMLAQFANITQMDQSQFSNLGSTIVALGNAGASTEKDIAMMGLRLAAAGGLAKMSTGDILGIANALASVGIEAEAGGTAFSKLIIEMKTSTEIGGAQLERFATVAGMTADQFKVKFQTDASGAIVAFVQGLKKIDDGGGSVIQTLDAMGITEVRMRDAILRSAAASDMLTGSIELGNKSFKENTALAEEASKRYTTTASQIDIMKNNFNALAVTVGEALIPPIKGFLDILIPTIKSMSEWAKQHPELTKDIVLIGAAVGGMSLALGSLLLVVKPFITTWGALHTLWVAGPKIMAAVSSGFTVITTAASTVVSGIGSIMTSGALLAAAPWIIGIGAIAIALGAIVISAYKTKQAFDELAVTQTNLDAKEKEYVESLKAHGVEIDANSLKNKDYNERLLVYHEAEKTSQDVVFRAAFEHYAKRAETEQEFAQGRNLRLNENINAEQAAFIVKQGYSAEYLRQILMYDKEKVDKLLESLGYEKESMIDTTKIAGALAEAYGMVATSAEAAAAVLERFAKLPPEIHEKITDLTEDYAEKLSDAADKTSAAFAESAQDVQDIEEDWAYAQQEMFQAHSQNIDDIAGDLGRTLDDLYQSFFEKQIETYNSMYQLEQDFRDKSIDRAQEYRDDSVDLASDTAKKKKALQEKIDAEEDEEKKKKLEKELKDLETETAYKQSIITREYKEEQARAARDLARAEERLQAKLAAQEQAFQQELAKEYERNQRRAEEEQRRYDDSLEKAQYAIDERLEKEQRKEDEISRREQKMLDDIYDWYVKSYDKILEKTGLTHEGITEAQNESNIAMTESFEDYINHSLDWLTYQTDTTVDESGKQKKAGVDAAKKRQAAWIASGEAIVEGEKVSTNALVMLWNQFTIDLRRSVNWFMLNVVDDVIGWFRRLYNEIADWFGWEKWGSGFSGDSHATGGVVQAKAMGGIVGGVQAMAGGGRAKVATVLAGEEGPELAVTPDSRAMLLGSGGPGLYTLPVGTEISTAAETSNLRLSNVLKMALGGTVDKSTDDKLAETEDHWRRANNEVARIREVIQEKKAGLPLLEKGGPEYVNEQTIIRNLQNQLKRLTITVNYLEQQILRYREQLLVKQPATEPTTEPATEPTVQEMLNVSVPGANMGVMSSRGIGGEMGLRGGGGADLQLRNSPSTTSAGSLGGGMPQSKAGGGSGQTININTSFPNLTIREEADIDKISQRISQQIPMALSMVLS